RHVDLCAFVATGHLAVLCPEVTADEARELADALVEVCAARAGLALCGDDGTDAETLLAAARAASMVAAEKSVALASTTFTSLTFGDKTVLVADPGMVRLYELVQRLAKSELAVLVQGESGAGKELVAAALHYGSPRAGKPLLAVNCAALQETLLESELFGHERGAFTGATATRQGLFESVAGGTLFLDEVAEMSAALQAKLLRALETRRITRLGDTREREVDFRVVTASHRDLSAEVKAGRFREDLYFRLVGAAVWVPPLRDRKRELPLLARRFLEESCAKTGRPVPVLAPDTLRLLGEHAWPGNVRELRNAMEFAAATVEEGTVEPWHLRERINGEPPAPGREPAAPAPGAPPTFRPIADELRELERRRMLEALSACGWNQKRAAAALSMPLRTFVTRFGQFGLAEKSPRRG
ncbi:MAG: sigma-54-dependent Fis family transcriptional regulator, partial [Myxococcaceae bacterium]|nr:sigma-54-dependent Fis family transcriptional regulator [Myxococcaceae bacterium]